MAIYASCEGSGESAYLQGLVKAFVTLQTPYGLAVMVIYASSEGSGES